MDHKWIGGMNFFDGSHQVELHKATNECILLTAGYGLKLAVINLAI